MTLQAMNELITRSFRLLLLAAAMLSPVACATAQPAQSGFRVHWGIAGNPARNIDLSNAPVRRDTEVFYQQQFGNFPDAGPQVVELHPGGRAAYMVSHLAKVRADVIAKLPDPNWSGLAIIDYEGWMPYWSGHAEPIRAAWRNYIRTHRSYLIQGMLPAQEENVFRSTYLEATRAFWEATLNESKQLRPNATWGFYHLPQTPYWAWLCNDPNCIADRNALKRANDEELAWLYEAVDAHFPSLYTHYRSVPNPQRSQHENTPEENELYFRRNIEEAIRVGRGKPVIPFVWYRYHPQNNTINTAAFLNDTNLRQMFTVPRELGSPGVVLWGWVPDQDERNELVQFLNQRLFPMLNELFNNEPPPPPPPDPGSGSGATGGSGTGSTTGGGGGGGGGGLSSGGSSGGGSGSGVTTVSGGGSGGSSGGSSVVGVVGSGTTGGTGTSGTGSAGSGTGAGGTTTTSGSNIGTGTGSSTPTTTVNSGQSSGGTATTTQPLVGGETTLSGSSGGTGGAAGGTPATQSAAPRATGGGGGMRISGGSGSSGGGWSGGGSGGAGGGAPGTFRGGSAGNSAAGGNGVVATLNPTGARATMTPFTRAEVQAAIRRAQRDVLRPVAPVMPQTLQTQLAATEEPEEAQTATADEMPLPAP
jgi:hypothetical protein